MGAVGGVKAKVWKDGVTGWWMFAVPTPRGIFSGVRATWEKALLDALAVLGTYRPVRM